MRVFVTGATGFIGHAVAGALARAGHSVLGLTRSKDKARELELLEVEPVLGNLDNAALLASAVQRCDAIVHCAAEYSQRYLALDRSAAHAMLEECERVGLPRLVVYTSGVWVYGNTGTRMANEGDAPNPLPQVAPRVDNERMVLAATSGQVRTIVLRPGCVYGGSGSLTSAWFEAAAAGAPEVIGDGSNRWAMVHRDDLADAYLRAVESSFSGQVFNVVDRSRCTVADCVAAAARALGSSATVRSRSLDDARKLVGPMADCLALDQHVDASKAQRWLGWNPRHGGFVDGVEGLARAWRASRGV